jgi:hypothetical protein
MAKNYGFNTTLKITDISVSVYAGETSVAITATRSVKAVPNPLETRKVYGKTEVIEETPPLSAVDIPEDIRHFLIDWLGRPHNQTIEFVNKSPDDGVYTIKDKNDDQA